MNEIKLVEAIKNAISSNQLKIFDCNRFEANRPDYFERLKRLDINTLKTLYLYLLSDGKEVLDDIVYVLEDPETKLRNYISDPVVERIYKKAKQVSREIHRIKGLLRFREVEGGYLYAKFSPDFNIIIPVSNYFADRLRSEKILIHDIKRNVAAFCHRGRVSSAQIVGKIPDFTDNEREIVRLWLKYFDRISIKDRLNLRIQKQKVPLKYRKSVVEFTERVET